MNYVQINISLYWGKKQLLYKAVASLCVCACMCVCVSDCLYPLFELTWCLSSSLAPLACWTLLPIMGHHSGFSTLSKHCLILLPSPAYYPPSSRSLHPNTSSLVLPILVSLSAASLLPTSKHFTWPYYLSIDCLTFCPIMSTFIVPLMCSFVILPFLVNVAARENVLGITPAQDEPQTRYKLLAQIIKRKYGFLWTCMQKQ